MESLTQRILVGTDFSEASYRAVEAAQILAVQNRAKVFLVHVFSPQTGPVSTRYMAAQARLAMEPEIEKDLRGRLEELRKSRLGDVEDVEIHLVLDKSPADGLCHYAEKHDVDLIVVATHGRTGLTRFLIGSVAERVVRRAPCPVLTLRTPGPKNEE